MLTKNVSFGTPQSYFWRIFILSHFICRGGYFIHSNKIIEIRG
nr:MAG TPA: hypothetical protein [Caudoviricetes sp.]